jgi:Raf kinase inhibitor-like YbhB/YbcL family protein
VNFSAKLARVISVLACIALLGAEPAPQQAAKPAGLVLTSDEITQDGPLPSAITSNLGACTGGYGVNKIPKLAWTGAPPKTKSYAIIVSDIDAYPTTFYHWIVVNIPTSVLAVPPDDPQAKVPGLEARNSFGSIGYAGPCPPKKEAPHHYYFTVYALNVPRLAKIGPNSAAKAVLSAMNGHVLARSALMGRFGR